MELNYMLTISYFQFTRIPTQRRLRYLSHAPLMTQMARNAAAGLSSMCESMKFCAFNLTPYNAYFILPISEKSLKIVQHLSNI